MLVKRVYYIDTYMINFPTAKLQQLEQDLKQKVKI